MATPGGQVVRTEQNPQGEPPLYLMPASKLILALADPARRNRAVLIALGAYVIAWTAYAIVAKSTQDIHPDTAELVAWSNELALGYSKHPPLGVYVVKGWMSVFPVSDWSFYLLGMVNAALALWIAWRLSSAFLGDEKRSIGLALLALVPFYSFLSLNYNHNTLLMPLWAAATLFFFRSFETRHLGFAALAGMAGGLGVLGKYWTIMLLAGFLLASLTDPRRREYFRSAAPWVSILVGGLFVAPHLVWLYRNDFVSIAYASAVHADGSMASVAAEALKYLAALPLYLGLPIAAVAIAARPSRAAIADALFPPAGNRRFAAVLFWTPLLLPIPISLILGIDLISLWAIPAMTLLPVLLLGSPLVRLAGRAAPSIMTVAIALPILALLCAPIVAWNVFVHPNKNGSSHYRELSSVALRMWHDQTGKPLKFVAGDRLPAVGIAFYAPDRQLVYSAQPFSGQRERDAGVLAVCRGGRSACAWLERPKGMHEASGIREVALSRRALGWYGEPATFSILIVPPAS